MSIRSRIRSFSTGAKSSESRLPVSSARDAGYNRFVPRANQQLTLFADTGANREPQAFSVRESRRARRLAIKVYPRGNVEVVVPQKTPAADVAAFVREHEDWIRRTREHFASAHSPEPFALPQRIELHGIARTVLVRYRPRRRVRGVRFRQLGDTVVLTGRVEDEEACVCALRRWLAGVAREAFGTRLESLSALLGTPYRRLQIRAQKTCWGSHSSTGTISLNYCALFLQPALLRYLLIHELCHARHMDHSARFWRLVERFEPDYRRLDEQLASAWRQIPVWLGVC